MQILGTFLRSSSIYTIERVRREGRRYSRRYCSVEIIFIARFGESNNGKVEFPYSVFGLAG